MPDWHTLLLSGLQESGPGKGGRNGVEKAGRNRALPAFLQSLFFLFSLCLFSLCFYLCCLHLILDRYFCADLEISGDFRALVAGNFPFFLALLHDDHIVFYFKDWTCHLIRLERT